MYQLMTAVRYHAASVDIKYSGTVSVLTTEEALHGIYNGPPQPPCIIVCFRWSRFAVRVLMAASLLSFKWPYSLIQGLNEVDGIYFN